MGETLSFKQLQQRLWDEVNAGIENKAHNIIERAAVETRVAWKKAADDFPSPTLARKRPYEIGFDGVTHSGGMVEVVIGSHDPLLRVIEDGGAHHTPHGYGQAAAEKAAKGMNRAAARIDPFHGR